MLVGEPEQAAFFENAASELQGEPLESGAKEMGPGYLFNYLTNYQTSDLRGLMNLNGTTFAELKITPEHLAHLVMLIYEKKVTSRQAKDMLAKMFETGADPEEIMQSENIGIGDVDEVEAVVLAVIAEHHAAVADYKKGKLASLQFLIGQAMAKLKGRARPDMLKEIFEKNLV
jgi:aspartyl-tRNA(Asn)/glutamyl-tRNA(Gln) amidotransferase subunit B